MSCFGGKMKEYGKISLDRFDNFHGNMNLKSTAYFLSHFHKDHTVGMTCERFYERLKLNRNKIFLYCTDVTKTLMMADDHYKRLGKYVKILPVGVPTLVSVPDEYTDVTEEVTVTLLQAGHCPGSVMFFFEGAEGNVLYTGDFRWESNEATRMETFKSGDSVKDIQSLYVDTTFCIPEAFYIPSRSDCVDAVYDLVQDWTAQSPYHYVHISSKSKYGHEHLLKELSQKLGMKIHILANKFQVYEQIPDIHGAFTVDPSETRVHACYWDNERDRRSRLPCGYIPQSHGEEVKVMVIRPSTMWFTQGVQIKEIHVKTRSMHRVCYSFHSSFSEVRDLVTYLKPRRAFPNVKPLNQTMEQVQARLNQFLRMVHREHISRAQSPQIQPLGVLRKIKSNNIENNASLSDSEELCFGESMTPVKRRRRASSGPSTQSSSQKITVKYSQLPIEPSHEQSQGFECDNESLAKSDSQSSYAPSHHSDEEMDLTADDNETDLEKPREVTEKLPSPPPDGSCLAYLSGDEDDDEYVEFVTQQAILGGNSPENENSRKIPDVESTTNHSVAVPEPESRQRRHSSADLFTDSEKSSTTQDEAQDGLVNMVTVLGSECVSKGTHKRKIFSDEDRDAVEEDGKKKRSDKNKVVDVDEDYQECNGENSAEEVDDGQSPREVVNSDHQVKKNKTEKGNNKSEQKLDQKSEQKSDSNSEQNEHKCEHDFDSISEHKLGNKGEHKLDNNSEQKVTNNSEHEVTNKTEHSVDSKSEHKVGRNSEQKVDSYSEQKITNNSENNVNSNREQKVSSNSEKKITNNSENKVNGNSTQNVDSKSDQLVDSNHEHQVDKVANNCDSEQKVTTNREHKVDSCFNSEGNWIVPGSTMLTENINPSNNDDLIILKSPDSVHGLANRTNGISPSVVGKDTAVANSHNCSVVEVVASVTLGYTEGNTSGNVNEESEVTVIECASTTENPYTGEVFDISDDDSDVTIPPEDAVVQYSSDDEIEVIYSSGSSSSRIKGSNCCTCTCPKTNLSHSHGDFDNQKVTTDHSQQVNRGNSPGPISCSVHSSYSSSGSGICYPSRGPNSPRRYPKLRRELLGYSTKRTTRSQPYQQKDFVLVDLTSDSEEEEKELDKRVPPGGGHDNDSDETIEYCSPAKKFCPSV